MAVSATVLTRDSERRLGDVLAALAWCDEVVVLDTGSIDSTLHIASRYPNVSIHLLPGPFPGFGQAHRHAVALARNDWILSIDSDEVVSEALSAEIRGLAACPRTVYALAFENFFNGRLITSCGWHREHHERFFSRRTTNFCAGEVHERVQTAGLAVRRLRGSVRHYSYESSDDFLRKMRSYGQLFAAQHVGRKSSSPGKALRRGAWAFAKSYLLQRGFAQGYEGLVISAYKAQTTYWKYLLLHDANQRR
ncbi:MAG: glycosyltransferase family 2 protein [Pseudomonadota bacterium]|nr:glycosyltransferase family 2 protein [Pseudomonadota bacterium]